MSRGTLKRVKSPGCSGRSGKTSAGKIYQNPQENVYTVVYSKNDATSKVPDEQLATVTYKDAKGAVIGTENFSGFSNTKILFDTLNYIATNLSGYKVETDGTKDGAEFDKDKNVTQNYIVTVDLSDTTKPDDNTPSNPDTTTPTTTPENPGTTTTPTTPDTVTPTTPETTTPTTPVNTGTPETVITPEVPETDEHDLTNPPTTEESNTDKTPKVTLTDDKKVPEATVQTATLPQTGEKTDSTAVLVGIGLLGIVGFLGLAGIKKREEN